ncbi:MAG: hypothetical protein P4L61_01920 [Candidatus Pacebacteria bacterium]|nr:hypothetical protein [Candidatus Paceibacterota bacterium]
MKEKVVFFGKKLVKHERASFSAEGMPRSFWRGGEGKLIGGRWVDPMANRADYLSGKKMQDILSSEAKTDYLEINHRYIYILSTQTVTTQKSTQVSRDIIIFTQMSQRETLERTALSSSIKLQLAKHPRQLFLQVDSGLVTGTVT